VGEIIRFADDTMFKVSWLRPPGTNGTKLYESAAPAGAGKLTQAARDVLAERERQVSVEGWTHAHDDGENDVAAMADAAACYAMHAGQMLAGAYSAPSTVAHKLWPWDVSQWKPTTPRRDLVKSAALAIAEIERIDRLAARTDAEGLTDEQIKEIATNARRSEAMEFIGSTKVASHDDVEWAIRCALNTTRNGDTP
jgi:hypothetical protein